MTLTNKLSGLKLFDSFERHQFHLNQFSQFVEDKKNGNYSKAIYFGGEQNKDELVDIVSEVYELTSKTTNTLWREYSSTYRSAKALSSFVPDSLKLFYLGRESVGTNCEYYRDYSILSGWSLHLLGSVIALNQMVPYLNLTSAVTLLLTTVIGSGIRVAQLETGLDKKRKLELNNALEPEFLDYNLESQIEAESLYSTQFLEQHD